MNEGTLVTLEKKPEIDLSKISKDDAMSLVSNQVYAATALLEQLEAAGLLSGNGHHVRQKIAQVAADEVNARWITPKVPSVLP